MPFDPWTITTYASEGNAIESAPEGSTWIRSAWRRTSSGSGPMDPNVFARNVLRAVQRNRAIIIEPAWWRLFWWADRLFPRFGSAWVRRSCGISWSPPG